MNATEALSPPAGTPCSGDRLGESRFPNSQTSRWEPCQPGTEKWSTVVVCMPTLAEPGLHEPCRPFSSSRLWNICARRDAWYSRSVFEEPRAGITSLSWELQHEWEGEHQPLQSLGVNTLGSGLPSLSERLSGQIAALADHLSPELGEKVREILSLEPGWDGETAQSVRLDVVANALSLLARLRRDRPELVMPFVAPTFDGGLSLDWTSPRRTLEVEAEARGWSVVGTTIDRDGTRGYFEAVEDAQATRMTDFCDWFRGDLPLWPTA